MPEVYTPRTSRETRLLLTTAALAMAVLWILARVRYPDRPVSPSPVQPLFSQLSIAPKFEQLASEVADVLARVDGALIPLRISAPRWNGFASDTLVALKLTPGSALTWLPPDMADGDLRDATVLGRDWASGL